MILLQANQVSRTFADETLYEDVTFNIQTQDRLALVGRNGVGKSTLIKQIMGQEPISSGQIIRAKGLKIGYLAQHVTVDSPLTIWQEMLTAFKETLSLRQAAEQVAEALAHLSEDITQPAYQEKLAEYDTLLETLNERNAYAIEAEIRTVLHGFGYYEADYDTPINALSGGQKTRLAIAKILLMDYDLLILDEPTNHLDMQTLAWLEDYLKSYRGALLIVSHDRYFLDHVATQVIELRHKTLHIYKGNYSYYIKEKVARLEQAQKQYELQQAEIQKLETFVQKNLVRASTTKRAQSRRKQLEKMVRLEKPKQDSQAPKIQFSAAKDSGERVIEATNLTIGYQANQPIAQHINLDLRRQEAIAIVGPNGVGKTTLLKTLLNQLPALAGSYQLGTNVTIGYYDQSIHHLNPELSVLETLWQAHDTTDEKVIRTILGSFLFSGDSVEKKIKMLSGGEKARVSLALLATQHDNTLLLDEPTNHLDIDSKEVLEEALIDYNGTLLFVSHDRYFINRIATQVLELSATAATLYLGDYDYYLAKKAEAKALADLQVQAQTKSVSKESPSPALAGAQLSYEESKQAKRELKRLELAVNQALSHVEMLEDTIAKLHQDLTIASQQNDVERLNSLHLDLLAAQNQQAQAMETWEAAALELEAYNHL